MRVSVIVLTALAATALMRRRSAAVRHWILSTAILCAAATPLLERIVPPWQIGLRQSAGTPWVEPPDERVTERARTVARGGTPATAVARDPEVTPSKPLMAIDPGQLVLPIWITGAAIHVLVMLAGFARLTWLARRAQHVTDAPWVNMARDIASRYQVTRLVTILASDHPSLVVTWGWLRPQIVVPHAARMWSADRIRIVLSHELAHVQRGDWGIQLAAELLRSVYWFNPLLWIAGTRLRQESEHACDDAVLGLGVNGSEYATHLLDLARDAARHRSPWLSGIPAPAMIRPSSFERRVTAMLNADVNRTPLTRPARLLAGAALFAITIPLAGFGQPAFSTVTGIVTDPEGRMIPGVEVVLMSTQREARYEVKTNRLGQFEFTGVTDGDYVLEAQFIGFRNLREPVSVAGQPVQRNLSMEVGMLQETITVVGGDTAPAARPERRREGPQLRPVAEYDPCSASPVGGCLKPPTKIRDVKPQYPQHLSDTKVGGVVVLSAKIDTNGSIVTTQLANPADRIDPALAQAAIAAVNQWEFTPTQLGGVPIEVEMQVTVNFVIRK
jgi:TonB family protein